MSVRTRIAPSPTGDPHVGTAYIALFNLCFARQHDGAFILRIEDTDQIRSNLNSEQLIYESLRWLGLEWDEGPDVGGAHGPYKQSERVAIYREHADILLEKGHAFKCYRTPEELDELRELRRGAGKSTALEYADLELSPEEQAKREAEGAPYVVRMHVPEEGLCKFNDRLRGEIEIDWHQIDAQILLKADGMPTYHLANVVDDHLMKITHVIRGEEWINSTPKHELLYEYFGWDKPEWIHLPLLRNPDKSKLSKRKNPTSILFYQRMGFMPEALVNYLGRMGWSMPNEEEKFSLEQMQSEFNIDRVSLGGPIFDMEKLRWLNGCWIREDLSLEEFADRLMKSWAYNQEFLLPAIKHFKERIETYSDLAPAACYLVSGMLDLSETDFIEGSNLDKETQLKVLQFTLWKLENLHHWDRDEIFKQLKHLSENLNIKIKDFLAPIFIAIAGSTASISVMDSMELLGPDMSRARIRHALDTLGGVSKKAMKRLEKEYQTLDSPPED